MQSMIDLVVRFDVLLVFVASLASHVGLPVPASPFLVIVGGLAASAGQWPATAFALAIVGTLLGDAVWYVLGRVYGHKIMRTLCRISISPDSCVRQSESFFERWGGSSLIAAKFVPGISVVAPPMAGALGLSIRKFVLWDIAAAAVWTSAYMGLGAVFHDAIDRVLDGLAQAGHAAGAFLGVIVLVYLGVKWVRRRKVLHELAMERVNVTDLVERLTHDDKPLIVDVRGPIARGADPRCIPGAIVVPLDEVRTHARSLHAERDIVTYCSCPNDASAVRAAQHYAAAGRRRARPLAGGLDAWLAAGQPVERLADAPPSLREAPEPPAPVDARRPAPGAPERVR